MQIHNFYLTVLTKTHNIQQKYGDATCEDLMEVFELLFRAYVIYVLYSFIIV